MYKPKITGLVACDPVGVIALNHHLPWRYPDEIKFFRAMIAGQIIIMGATTYLEMPAWLLKKSYCVVFSREPAKYKTRNIPNLVIVSNFEAFLNLKNLPDNKACFLIGGAKIIDYFLEHQLIDDFILTEVTRHFWGDTFFPLKKIAYWPKTRLVKTPDFCIYHYINPFKRYLS